MFHRHLILGTALLMVLASTSHGQALATAQGMPAGTPTPEGSAAPTLPPGPQLPVDGSSVPASVSASPVALVVPATYSGAPDELVPYREVEGAHRFFLRPPFRLPPARKVALPDKEVRIGLLAPLQDAPDTDVGLAMKDGLTLAVEEANARGGCRGIPFRIIPENALPLWGAAGNSLVRLEEQGVSVIVGAHVSDDSHVALRLSLKLEVPIVCPTTSDPTLTEHAVPWMVRTCASDRAYGLRFAQLLFQKMGFKRVGVLRENSSHGRRGIAKFRAAAQRLGHPIPIEMRYQRGEQDFKTQLTRLHQESVEAVMLWSHPIEAGLIAKQMREMGLKIPIFAAARAVSDQTLEVAKGAAEGMLMLTDYDPTNPATQVTRFREAFTRRFGHEPAPDAARAYDAGVLVTTTLALTGPGRRDLMEGLIQWMGKTVNGATGEFALDATLSRLGAVTFVRVEKGRLHFLGTALPEGTPK